MRRWRLRLGVTVVAAVIAGGAVALAVTGDDEPSGDDAPGAASPAPELSATAEIRRSFNRPGLVVIAVTNQGTEDVRITSAELVSDSFEATGPQPFDSTIAPGASPRDLQVEYGMAQCPDGADSVTGPATVALVTEDATGAEHDVELELPHPNGTLDRLLRTDCGAQVLAAAVEVSLGALEPEPDGTVGGTLTATRVDGAAEPVAIDDVRGSVLFTIAADAVTTTDPGQAQLPVRFDVLGCSGHAIGDAKRPYGFTAWVRLGDSEPIPTEIAVDDEHRAALDAMQAVRCEDASRAHT